MTSENIISHLHITYINSWIKKNRSVTSSSPIQGHQLCSGLNGRGGKVGEKNIYETKICDIKTYLKK